MNRTTKPLAVEDDEEAGVLAEIVARLGRNRERIGTSR
jgi:hypothetical protein